MVSRRPGPGRQQRSPAQTPWAWPPPCAPHTWDTGAAGSAQHRAFARRRRRRGPETGLGPPTARLPSSPAREWTWAGAVAPFRPGSPGQNPPPAQLELGQRLSVASPPSTPAASRPFAKDLPNVLMKTVQTPPPRTHARAHTHVPSVPQSPPRASGLPYWPPQVTAGPALPPEGPGLGNEAPGGPHTETECPVVAEARCPPSTLQLVAGRPKAPVPLFLPQEPHSLLLGPPRARCSCLLGSCAGLRPPCLWP